VTTVYQRVAEVLWALAQQLMKALWAESRQLRAGGPHLGVSPARRGPVKHGPAKHGPVKHGAGGRGPVKHIGATESFGRELRALRNVEVSPELISDIETELRWGLIWHEFEMNMQAEVDRIFAPCLELVECKDFDEVREMVGLRELAMA
jgi:hypothetical protein